MPPKTSRRLGTRLAVKWPTALILHKTASREKDEDDSLRRAEKNEKHHVPRLRGWTPEGTDQAEKKKKKKTAAILSEPSARQGSKWWKSKFRQSVDSKMSQKNIQRFVWE